MKEEIDADQMIKVYSRRQRVNMLKNRKLSNESNVTNDEGQPVQTNQFNFQFLDIIKLINSEINDRQKREELIASVNELQNIPIDKNRFNEIQ